MDLSEINQQIDEINTFLQEHLWMDFEVVKYQDNELVLWGSLSMSYPYNIEIIFTDIYFVSLPFDWHTDTKVTILSIVEDDEARRINEYFRVEIGNFLFCFKPKDKHESTKCLIGARKIRYNISK